jgi:intein/homing endonuclease
MKKLSEKIKSLPPNLRAAFIKGLQSKDGDKNPYLNEIKNNNKITYSRAFINAWYSGRSHRKIYGTIAKTKEIDFINITNI